MCRGGSRRRGGDIKWGRVCVCVWATTCVYASCVPCFNFMRGSLCRGSLSWLFTVFKSGIVSWVIMGVRVLIMGVLVCWAICGARGNSVDACVCKMLASGWITLVTVTLTGSLSVAISTRGRPSPSKACSMLAFRGSGVKSLMLSMSYQTPAHHRKSEVL